MKKAFSEYVKTFDQNDSGIVRKIKHSERVAKLSIVLAEKLKWDDESVMLAHQIGLLHDIGRFHEWKRLRNYLNIDFDHAAYGVKLLKRKAFYKEFNIDEYSKEVIFHAIYWHNKIKVPNAHETPLVKLIRDADKIDIFHILATENKLPIPLIESTKISPKVLKSFIAEEPVKVKDCKTTGDYVLLALAFIYDINYQVSLEIIRKGKYLSGYYKILKNRQEFKVYFDIIKKYIKEKGAKDNVRSKI